ncbi:D-hexose-6-phosphate mutarotase [Methylotetracoccus oryzae]|uniref:D-hexose-6-phosphate mutarotase n=1 Tax=Methylotetracoccus oryzae TaxID=1919059 RepID=UPI001117B4BB|nr:D-hexose-6-phosphate mutarotase [Methylotetracoccus oryzae]
MPDIAALNAHFGIPDAIHFTSGPNETAIIEIRHPHATGRVALRGAQILEWVPQGEEPVLWLSPCAQYASGKAIRGGIPICWPWFGAHPEEPTFPAHGFARTHLWIVEHTDTDNCGVSVRLRLLHDETTEALWPHACSLTLSLRIGSRLELALSTRNMGAEAITISEALHAYFRVTDIATARVQGLEGAVYVDKTDQERSKRQAGAIVFEAETDRIYTGVNGECRIDDPGYGRRIRIEKSGSGSTIVWNPGKDKTASLSDMPADGYRQMVCVESGNADRDAVRLLPGDTHTLSVAYTVERIA